MSDDVLPDRRRAAQFQRVLAFLRSPPRREERARAGHGVPTQVHEEDLVFDRVVVLAAHHAIENATRHVTWSPVDLRDDEGSILALGVGESDPWRVVLGLEEHRAEVLIAACAEAVGAPGQRTGAHELP